MAYNDEVRSSNRRSSWTVREREKNPAPQIIADPLHLRRVLTKALNDGRCSLRSAPPLSDSLEQAPRIPLASFEIREGQGILCLSEDVPPELAGAANGNEPWLFMIFAAHHGVIGFRANWCPAPEGQLRFRLPDRIVRTQKRLELRYPIPAGYEIGVRFLDPSSTLEAPPWIYGTLSDLSVTGLSIRLNEDLAHQGPALLARRFSVGTKIKDLLFRIRNREIHVSAEIMGFDRSRLRVRFLRMSDPDRDQVKMYVIENLVQYDSTVDLA